MREETLGQAKRQTVEYLFSRAPFDWCAPRRNADARDARERASRFAADLAALADGDAPSPSRVLRHLEASFFSFFDF